MHRRDFFRKSAVGGALLATGNGKNPLDLLESRSGVEPPRNPVYEAFDLEEATIVQLQADMVEGKRTARSITGQYLARIESLDRKGPNLRHVLETNPDALSIADGLDRERKARGVRGPLHGIPILLKDNIDTADRMTTTAGSLALAGSIPLQDAFIAAKLRAAGAILLGKTNLSEWANFRSTHASSGWSGRGGPAAGRRPTPRRSARGHPCGHR